MTGPYREPAPRSEEEIFEAVVRICSERLIRNRPAPDTLRMGYHARSVLGDQLRCPCCGSGPMRLATPSGFLTVVVDGSLSPGEWRLESGGETATVEVLGEPGPDGWFGAPGEKNRRMLGKP